MDITTFRKLLPSLKNVDLLYLQGWGEPFLNPNFCEFVRLAKSTGVRVGTTTNGMNLDNDSISAVVSSGVDIVTLSLAGFGDQNDRLRKGASFERVLEVIKKLSNERKHARAGNMQIHVAHLALKSGVDGLKQIPRLLEDTGTDSIIINTLDFMPTPELANEVIAPRSVDEYDQWQKVLDEVKADASDGGLAVNYYLRHPHQRRQFCAENVDRSCFISADGTVSPCVFTNLPISASQSEWQDITGGFERMVFGNINSESLSRIWGKRRYREFRKSFCTNTPPGTCLNCPKLYLTLR